MTALTQDANIVKLGTDELPPPALLALPVAASTKLFAGGAVASDSSGNAVPAGSSTALFVWGRCERAVDNSAGTAGAQTVLVRPGVYYYNNDGSISAANIGQAAYFVDDNTVGLSALGTSAVRQFAGIIQPPGSGQAGISFSTNTQVPVYVGFPACTGITHHLNVPFNLAALQALTSGTAFNVGFALPSNARLEAAAINVGTALSGGGLTAATMTLQGGSDSAGSIIASTSVFTGAQAVIATPGSNPYANRGGQQIKGTITATGAALSAITAGSLSVDLFYTIVA